jgi:hypothetical protein
VFAPIHVPFAEQLLTPVQLNVEQSTPSHPDSHWQVSGAVQVPLPEQSLTPAQVGKEQSMPVQPALHWQVFAPIQVPFAEQLLTSVQLKVEQSTPSHPASQRQVSGAVHVPFPEQSLTATQVGVEQSSPDQPESHWQVSSAMHVPLPEQSLTPLQSGGDVAMKVSIQTVPPVAVTSMRCTMLVKTMDCRGGMSTKQLPLLARGASTSLPPNSASKKRISPEAAPCSEKNTSNALSPSGMVMDNGVASVTLYDRVPVS